MCMGVSVARSEGEWREEMRRGEALCCCLCKYRDRERWEGPASGKVSATYRGLLGFGRGSINGRTEAVQRSLFAREECTHAGSAAQSRLTTGGRPDKLYAWNYKPMGHAPHQHKLQSSPRRGILL